MRKSVGVGDFIITDKSMISDKFDPRWLLGILAIVGFVMGYFYLLNKQLLEDGATVEHYNTAQPTIYQVVTVQPTYPVQPIWESVK